MIYLEWGHKMNSLMRRRQIQAMRVIACQENDTYRQETQNGLAIPKPDPFVSGITIDPNAPCPTCGRRAPGKRRK